MAQNCAHICVSVVDLYFLRGSYGCATVTTIGGAWEGRSVTGGRRETICLVQEYSMKESDRMADARRQTTPATVWSSENAATAPASESTLAVIAANRSRR